MSRLAALQTLSPPPGASRRDRVYYYLLEKIENGSYGIGDLLPSTRELANRFAHSVTPANQAIALLHEQGFVQRIRGSGVRVIARRKTDASALIKPSVDLITTLIARTGFQPGRSLMHTLPAIDEWLLSRLSVRRDMRLTVSTLEGDVQRMLLSHLRDALVYRPKVVVISSPQDLSDEVAKALLPLQSAGTRIVYSATHRHLPELDRVVMNFEEGQYELTRHLLENGHRRVLRLRTASGAYFEALKQAGFTRALLDYGFTEEDANRSTLDVENAPHDPKELLAFLSSRLEPSIRAHSPTAIMAYDDPAVAAVRLILKRMGRAKILVTGYDNDWDDLESALESRFGREALAEGPPITVDTRLPEVGKTLADLAIGRVFDTLPARPQRRFVDQQLVIPGKFPEGAR